MTPSARPTAQRAAQRARRQRGSGTVLVAGLSILVVVASVMAICLVGWLASERRAADVADLAALAAARAQIVSGDACAVARSTARANGARATACSVEATAVDFVVEVTVSVEARPLLRVGDAPRSVARTAKAGPLNQR